MHVGFNYNYIKIFAHFWRWCVYSLIFEEYFVENKDINKSLVLIMNIDILSSVPLSAVFSILTIPINANNGHGGMYNRIIHSKYDNNFMTPPW